MPVFFPWLVVPSLILPVTVKAAYNASHTNAGYLLVMGDGTPVPAGTTFHFGSAGKLPVMS